MTETKTEPTTQRARDFQRTFRSWARRVRAPLIARPMLSGLTFGLVAGAATVVAAWAYYEGVHLPGAAEAQLGHSGPWYFDAAQLQRFFRMLCIGAGGFGIIGLLAGFVIARRKRWTDESVALYLDSKLATDEAIATALDMDRAPDSNAPARATVVDQATEALSTAPPKGIWPRVWRTWHAAAPLAVGALVFLGIQQLTPMPAAPPPPPGSELVTLQDTSALDEVIDVLEALERNEPNNPRIKELRERAEKLREKLKKGMPKREAQEEIAKLKEDIAAERQKFGSGESRQGLEAALSQLNKNEQLKDASDALGDRDLTAFDQEMEKLANKLEAEDRDAAKKALEEAEKAAREKGANDVADALKEQRKLMEERAKRAQAMRDLAKAMGDGLSEDAKKALRDFNQSGSPDARQRLGEALGKALQGMTPEERKKLGEKMKEMAENMDPNAPGGGSPMSKEQLEQMQKQLESPEGQKQLADQLKEWANQPPQSGGSQRQQQLGDAERGMGQVKPQPKCEGGQCEQGQQGQQGQGQGQKGQGQGQGQQGQGQKGQQGQGQKGQGQGQKGQGQGQGQQGQGQGQKGQGQGQGQQGQGQGQGQKGQGQGGLSMRPGGGPSGPGPGGGAGDHKGFSKPLSVAEIRARARARMNSGAPSGGRTEGRGAPRKGETANQRGTGALGQVGPGEVGNMERSEVPQEYRQQVGRYFKP